MVASEVCPERWSPIILAEDDTRVLKRLYAGAPISISIRTISSDGVVHVARRRVPEPTTEIERGQVVASLFETYASGPVAIGDTR